MMVPGGRGGGPGVLARSEGEDARSGGGDVNVEVGVLGVAGGGEEGALHHPLPLSVVQTLVAQSRLGEDQLEVAGVLVGEHSVTK